MTYHIKQAPVEEQDQTIRYACNYTSFEVCRQIATVISSFDPYSLYTVATEDGIAQSCFWYGQEQTYVTATTQST